MKRLKHIVSCLVIFVAINTSAQSDLDIKVKKQEELSTGFIYDGKPVAPQALERMFPSLAGARSADTVDLRINPFLSNSYRDTAWTFPWQSEAQKRSTYRSSLGASYYRITYKLDSIKASYFPKGSVAYFVFGMTRSGKYIIVSSLSGEDSPTQNSLFVLDVQGDQLIRLAAVDLPDFPAYEVELADNVIRCGVTSYPLPPAAR